MTSLPDKAPLAIKLKKAEGQLSDIIQKLSEYEKDYIFANVPRYLVELKIKKIIEEEYPDINIKQEDISKIFDRIRRTLNIDIEIPKKYIIQEIIYLRKTGRINFRNKIKIKEGTLKVNIVLFPPQKVIKFQSKIHDFLEKWHLNKFTMDKEVNKETGKTNILIKAEGDNTVILELKNFIKEQGVL